MNTDIQAIIFDITGVIFYISVPKLIQSIGYKDLALYYFQKYKNPFHECLMILDHMRQEVPGQFQDTATYKGTLLPVCFIQWQEGLISYGDLYHRIHDYLNNLAQQHYFSSTIHKRVIFKLLHAFLNPQVLLNAYSIIPSTANLIQQLKQTGHYRLYILSNMDQETWNGLKASHAQLFHNFDGIVTSCESHLFKPDVRIFNYLTYNYNLDPHQCCFVDDQIENIQAAEQLGMIGIHCQNPSQLLRTFEKKAIL